MMWLDSYVSSGVYEVIDAVRRGISAYSSFVHRFRLSGIKRVIVDLTDDMATFGTVIAFGLLAFALPPFWRSRVRPGTASITYRFRWNAGQHAPLVFPY